MSSFVFDVVESLKINRVNDQCYFCAKSYGVKIFVDFSSQADREMDIDQTRSSYVVVFDISFSPIRKLCLWK